jgi:dephospho-CoA kinase
VRRIGLTGSIGAGKSSVANILRDRQIPVLDADAVAREVSRFPEVLSEIKSSFGEEYLDEHGMNRQKIAALVFANPEARATLNAIIHPRVRQEMNRLQLELEAAGASAVVQDIPLLFENKLESLFDAVILVNSPLETRIARVMARDGSSRQNVLARDAAQMPASEKCRRATVVIENDGTESELEARTVAALEKIGL